MFAVLIAPARIGRGASILSTTRDGIHLLGQDQCRTSTRTWRPTRRLFWWWKRCDEAVVTTFRLPLCGTIYGIHQIPVPRFTHPHPHFNPRLIRTGCRLSTPFGRRFLRRQRLHHAHLVWVPDIRRPLSSGASLARNKYEIATM